MKSPYAKAIIGGIVAALTFLAPVIGDGVTVGEVLGAIVAGIVGTGLVYTVPNTPKGTTTTNTNLRAGA